MDLGSPTLDSHTNTYSLGHTQMDIISSVDSLGGSPHASKMYTSAHNTNSLTPHSISFEFYVVSLHATPLPPLANDDTHTTCKINPTQLEHHHTPACEYQSCTYYSKLTPTSTNIHSPSATKVTTTESIGEPSQSSPSQTSLISPFQDSKDAKTLVHIN